MDDNLWIEKYKPVKMEDILLPSYLTKKFNTFLKTNNIPNLILTGTSGIGKSTIIKCISHELFGKDYRRGVFELMTIDDRVVKNINSDITTFCHIKCPKTKLVIIDNVDDIIDKIQLQISVVMEKYKNKIKFIFSCNSTYEIIESIQSKCIILRIPTPTNNIIIKKLTSICEQEHITYEKSALKKISDISQGDFRTAINMLQTLYIKNNLIKSSQVNEIYNLPSSLVVKNIFDLCVNKKIIEAINETLKLKKSGYSGTDIVLSMIQTIKSDLCLDIPQNLKVLFLDIICYTTYCMSKSVDSDLQLVSCITNLCSV
jgi:replication factor C subunit 2/4